MNVHQENPMYTNNAGMVFAFTSRTAAYHDMKMLILQLNRLVSKMY